MKEQQNQNYTFALIVVIVVCFLLGFVTTMNNSMINFCKNAFNLTESQGQLVNTAFFGAYIFSVPLAMLMKKLGYKATLVLGLGVIALGFFLNFGGIGIFGENANVIYPVFLSCMFCVALGIVMLQLVANPYVNALGKPEKGAFRMTLSQTFNSLATTIAPIFVSMFIVNSQLGEDAYTASSIKTPFLGLGIFTLVLCVVLSFIKLPSIKEGEQEFDKGKKYKSSAFKYPHVILGFFAIFMYLGVEIGIPSFLPAKVDALGINISVEKLLPLYWGGLLVGRAVGTFILNVVKPRLLLISCVCAGLICVGLSFVLPGIYGIYALIVTGLFHSVMWPLIFNLALADVGPNTKTASGIINTGVIGAAILPPMMGLISETVSLGLAIGTMFIYYIYIGWFAASGSKIRTK